MKRIALIMILLSLTIIFAACQSQSTSTEPSKQTKPVTTTTQPPNVSIGALEFSSEQEMIDQIKLGQKTSREHQLETVEYYFRPAALPDGARLTGIRVRAIYLALEYIIGGGKVDLKTNELDFVWYRNMRGDDMKNSFMKAGIRWETMEKNARYSFVTIENLAYNAKTGELDPKLPKEQTCNMIMWVQDDLDFQVNAPLWFTKDDALKYCIAEKVQVK